MRPSSNSSHDELPVNIPHPIFCLWESHGLSMAVLSMLNLVAVVLIVLAFSGAAPCLRPILLIHIQLTNH